MPNHHDKIRSPLLTRRKFLEGSAVSAAALTLLPRSARAVAATVPAGKTITLGCIGVGAQGTRVMMDFLKMPDVQVVAVCDVNRESADYSEWGKDEIVNKERKLLNDPSWGSDWIRSHLRTHARCSPGGRLLPQRAQAVELSRLRKLQRLSRHDRQRARPRRSGGLHA